MILIEIAGFLGNDPEERFTPSGKRVVSFRVGVKVRHNNKDETVWWRVSIWGDRFDKMIPYLKKGSAVIVIGDMGKPELYVDREGKTQISLTLTAEMLKFSPFGRPAGKNENTSEFRASSDSSSGFGGEREGSGGQGFAAAAAFGQESEQEPDNDDEIPF